MQINPGLSITFLSPTHIQIGSGYRALELTGINQTVGSYLQRLREGIPDGTEHDVASEHHVSAADFELVMSKLAPLLVSTPFDDSSVLSLDQDHRGSLAGLRCVTPIFDGGRLRGLAPQNRHQFQNQRYSSALQIFGLGRTGIALTTILRDSGIGHINVWDSARVTEADIGTGLEDTNLGQVRSLAAAAMLNPKHQKPQIHPTGWLKQPPLANLATVHIRLGGIHTATVEQAKQHNHPYLAVTIRDNEIDIGPWVAEQASACPMCLEKALGNADTVRSQRVTALTSNTGGIETVAGAHLVAGLVATDVLSVIDSQRLRQQIPVTKHGVVPGMNLDMFTRVNLAYGWVQTFKVDPRPGCCAAVQELRIASTSAP